MNLLFKKISTHQNLIILASLLPIFIFALLMYNDSINTQKQRTIEHIQKINEQKIQVVKRYYKGIHFSAKEMVKTVSFLQKQAEKNIQNIQILQEGHIRDYYKTLEKNILSLSKKSLFQYIYSFKNRGKDVDETYIKQIYDFKNNLELKNVLMINKKGEVLYSSDDKELLHVDVNTISKPFSRVWKKIKDKRYNGSKTIYFTGLGYNKWTKKYEQYVISPFDVVQGFIAIKIDQNELDNAIKDITSLGPSAETYLVCRDDKQIYLASNRQKKVGRVGQKVDSVFIRLGFSKASTDIKYGSLGDIELIGYRPIKIKNITFSMQTTVKYIEVISPKIKGIDYFESFIRDYDFHNLMLVGINGEVYYTLRHKENYLTNIFQKGNKDIVDAIKSVFKTKKSILTDFMVYNGCAKKAVQFMLLPLTDNNDNMQAVVTLALDIDALNKKVMYSNDIYKTEESYIIGSDYVLRTVPKIMSKTKNIRELFYKHYKMQDDVVKNIFKTSKHIVNAKDYRDKEVLAYAQFFNIDNFKWAVITKIDTEEINAILKKLKNNILVFVVITSLLALAVMIVITNEKKKKDKELQHQATHDALTGLPNRQYVKTFLNYILASSKRKGIRGAVLFMDLDKFKFINDSYGHDAGDFVLKEVAKRLKSILRSEDIIARLGGDEFLLIIQKFSSMRDIDTLCNKIINTISKEIKSETSSYKVGVSIGVSVFPDDSVNPAEILQFADTAMYKTKESGRNGYTYYNKEMTEKSLQITQVLNELKYAIKHDELFLVYQPQIDIKTDKVKGVEALVRWQHPTRGLVMPNDFIPIAEDGELILELGRWVTKEACRRFKKWKEDGVNLDHISINFSAKQLQCLKCLKNVKTILKEFDFDPKWLEIEITEHTLISNFDNALSNINSFKEMGIKFSIDDFGTGYSSLSYLKSLRISTLKIDRDFIKDILSDENDLTIVKTIIVMAHALNYKVVAEGAETIDEVRVLKELGCDLVQGYYYAKPLVEDELLKYISCKKLS